MKTLIFIITSFCVSCLAKAQLPATGSLSSNQPSTTNLTSEIDGLLGVSENDIMQGIQGYGINVAKAIEQKVLDEVIAGIADAVVLAPIAEKIMTAYQKIKNNNLASEITKVKYIAKDALSRQLKIQYQAYKTEYSKFAANSRNPLPIKNSTTGGQATARTGELYGNYVDVVDEFWNNPAKRKIIEDEGLAFGIVGTAMNLNDDKELKAKMEIANKNYDPDGSSSGEVSVVTPYERIVLKQEIREEALRRQAALIGMQAATRTSIANGQRKLQKKRYAQTITLPSQNL